MELTSKRGSPEQSVIHGDRWLMKFGVYSFGEKNPVYVKQREGPLPQNEEDLGSGYRGGGFHYKTLLETSKNRGNHAIASLKGGSVIKTLRERYQ